MAWASWTTPGIYTGRGGVRTDEVGVITGNVTVHTTWDGQEADVSVQYTGTLEWFTVAGSPVPCRTERHSRNLHQAVIEGIKAGSGTSIPRLHEAALP
ncbi:hypothetical protein ACFRAI_40895 [Streptomyces sp. NPDC056637]|uniref:hypothetical protein n=1 Tax=unclassified Streptomyces TaxID=2593676 RepID=UPI00362D8D89